jgi:hypothetical protein
MAIHSSRPATFAAITLLPNLAETAERRPAFSFKNATK